jgi:hypothetical protein
MPGHPIPPGSKEQTKADVNALENLFDTHDAVFLLMDSRESRWLPTVLGSAKGKARRFFSLTPSWSDSCADCTERRAGL